MRVECPNCGGAHPAWDCKRPATKSTAARKDVLCGEQGRMGVMSSTPSVGTAIPEAGTQALPVDTNSPEMVSDSKSPRLGMDEVTGLEAARQVATPMTGKTKAERLGNTCGGGNANAGSSNGRTAEFDSANAGSSPAPASKRPRGRPRIHPDRKAYKAQWERDKRKRMKAKGEGE